MKLERIKNKTYRLNPKFIDLVVYMIDKTNCILIDSGYKKTADSEIIPFMKNKGINVNGVLCTHGHLDHAGGNCSLQKHFNAEIAAPYFESVFGESSYNMFTLRNNFRFNATGSKHEDFSCATDHVISPDQESLEICGIKFKTIPLHGHSPYQMGYITPDNVAYLADTIISEEMMEKTKVPYVFDIEKDIKAKRSLKNLDCDYYVLSHEGVYDDISNLIDLNITHTYSNIEKFLNLMDAPRTFEDHTAHVMNSLNIIGNVKKIVYIQEMLRNFVSYYMKNNLVDVFEKNNKLLIVKKS